MNFSSFEVFSFLFLSSSLGLSYFIMHFRAHYNVFMKAIEVGNEVLNLPTDVFDTDLRKGTIIDSGTTLAYFPDVVYEPLISKVHYKIFCYCLCISFPIKKIF